MLSQIHYKLAAWRYFSSKFLGGSGHEGFTSTKRRSAPAPFNKPDVSKGWSVRAFPGHICIDFIAKLQTNLPRKQTAAVEDRKSLILFFSPVGESLENESFLWGRRTSVGFYEPVSPGLRATSVTPYLFLCSRWRRQGHMTSIHCGAIINVHKGLARDQQLIHLAFLDRLVIDKANRGNCKARDNYVSGGVGWVFGFVPVIGNDRNYKRLVHYSLPDCLCNSATVGNWTYSGFKYFLFIIKVRQNWESLLRIKCFYLTQWCIHMMTTEHWSQTGALGAALL